MCQIFMKDLQKTDNKGKLGGRVDSIVSNI